MDDLFKMGGISMLIELIDNLHFLFSLDICLRVLCLIFWKQKFVLLFFFSFSFICFLYVFIVLKTFDVVHM